MQEERALFPGNNNSWKSTEYCYDYDAGRALLSQPFGVLSCPQPWPWNNLPRYDELMKGLTNVYDMRNV